MAGIGSSVRTYLTTDVRGRKLPSPEPVDLASEEIPYGAGVRIEVEVETGEPMRPMRGWLQPEERGSVCLFPTGEGSVFRGEVRVPWGLLWGGGEVEGLSGPPRFPLPDMLPWGSGEHVLRLYPRTIGGDLLGEIDIPFRIGAAPSPGGSPPRIVSLESDLRDNRVRLGQPWLLRARVEDEDDDVVVVIFNVLQGDFGQWWFMSDDGGKGDEVAGDGVFSFLRIGGDAWERLQLGAGRDVAATVSVQACDRRGNWSEPAVMEYEVCSSELPVWMEEPSAGGPDILEASISREEGAHGRPLLRARCEEAGVWVCARALSHPDVTLPLFDDGRSGDLAAGDGIYTAVPGLPPEKRVEMVVYAVSRAESTKTGKRMAVVCPAAF